MAEKQVLQAEAVVDRGIAANFAEELETAVQFRKETDQVTNGLKVELDVCLRQSESHKQQVEKIREELHEAKLEAERGLHSSRN